MEEPKLPLTQLYRGVEREKTDPIRSFHFLRCKGSHGTTEGTLLRCAHPEYSVALMVAPSTQLLAPHGTKFTSPRASLQELTSNALSTLSGEWSSLLHVSPSPHLFDQPEVALAAFIAREPTRPMSAIVSRLGEDLMGVLPVVPCRTFLGVIAARTLRGLSTHLGPRTELICRASQRDLAAQSSWEALREDTDWRVLELPNVPVSGPADSLTKHAHHDGYRVETFPAPSIPFVDLQSGISSSMPTSSRLYGARLETKLRKIEQFGEVQLRSYATIEEPLTRFLGLENTARKHLTTPPLRYSPAELSLYRNIGLWGERCGALKIFSLELNGAPLSMVYGMMWRDTYYALRIAYDKRFSMYSPGQLLVMLTLEELARQGAKSCELVGPPLPWKMVWTSTTRQHRSHFIFRTNKWGRTPLASACSLCARPQGIWRELCGR